MTDRSAAAKKAWVTIRRKRETKKRIERSQQEAKIKEFTRESFALFAVNEEVIYNNKRTVITAVQPDRVQVRGNANWISINDVREL